MTDTDNEFGVAIVGMAGRFPQANTVQAFWQNLCAGKECISFYSDEELIAAGINPQFIKQPNYVKAKGEVADIDKFDAAFFGIAPREAEITDPQHRILLQTAWAAFEDAGYVPESYPGDIGIFAGKSMDSYLMLNLMPHFQRVFSSGSLQAAIGNDKDSITTLIAYHLNLKGPAITIQSSSSTSLVAVCVACQSLLTYQCDMALAGGITLGPPNKTGYLAQDGGITSLDGHCRAFSHGSTGFVPGTGTGLVVLKRVSEAIRDGDHIYAVIKGFAVNNDGSEKISYTAPSIDAQAKAIKQAQRLADLQPDDITYVEAHGTGTQLGDPVEFSALTKAFAGASGKQYCALGSVKTNIGHLDTAAGVVGLIKASLAVHHGKIPATLHFDKPNAQIDLVNSPFYINTQLQDWQPPSGIRRAGVTSLGMGGTNAHVVLEQAVIPAITRSADSGYCILPFSAKTEGALTRLLAASAEHFSATQALDKRDVAFTLSQGRKSFNHRAAIVVGDMPEAATLLSECPASDLHEITGAPLPLGFLFSGQGSQYQGMTRQLYQRYPVYAEALDRCAHLLITEFDIDLLYELFDAEVSEAQAYRLAQTRLTQPLLFSIEYALAQLWASWGITPAVMVGHSLGEWVAAAIAGVFSGEEGLRLIALRAQVMDLAEPGAMLMVALSEDQIQALALTDVALAAVNAPGYCVMSGPVTAIQQLSERLTYNNVINRPLHTSHAFHSPMMQQAALQLKKALSKVTLHAPSIPIVSTLTGQLVSADTLTNVDYWHQQMLMPVRFAQACATAIQQFGCHFLEIGPGNTLTRLVQVQLSAESQRQVLSSLPISRAAATEEKHVLTSAAALWLQGYSLNWPALQPEPVQRVSLPTYQFESERHWVDSPEEQGIQPRQATDTGTVAARQPQQHKQMRPALSTDYVAAQTATQASLIVICEALLGIEGFGIDDNFFEAGGHSLMLGMLLAQAQEQFNVVPSFVEVLEAPTVRSLAELIDNHPQSTVSSQIDQLFADIVNQ